MPKSTSVTLAVDEKTLPMATITGRTDRRTDRQSATQYAAPPREEGRITRLPAQSPLTPRNANERNTQRCAISNCFLPLAVETLRALGEEAFRDIGRRIAVAAGKWRAAIHSVSVECSNVSASIAIQRGNAASVLGTASSDGCLDDVFYL